MRWKEPDRVLGQTLRFWLLLLASGRLVLMGISRAPELHSLRGCSSGEVSFIIQTVFSHRLFYHQASTALFFLICGTDINDKV